MLEIRNNFILAPLKLGYCIEKDGKVTQKHLNFYNSRTKHVGLASYEPLYLDKGLRETPSQLGIDSDDKIDGLKALNDIVHNNGTKTIAHLNHPGRLANPKIPGDYLISSTDKMCPSKGVAPKRMEESDIKKAIQLFVDGAKRAKEADFDAIELQFGHGYLVAQFLSPIVNDRNDEYGGSFENRSRFAVEVLEAVKNEVDLPVFIRMTGSEIIPGGIDVSESIKLAKILKSKGVEALHIVAGSGCETPPWFFQHMFIPKGKTWELAKKIKTEVDVPVVTVGRIHKREDIDFILNENKSDYIAIGRALVADPDVVGKYLGQVDGNIRPCLACSEGCLGGVASGKGLGCIVNPLIGREDLQIEPAKEKKNIAVVGGGLAGMEAAIRLTDRGHNVKIYEKNQLGGQFNLAWITPHKESLKELIDYYKSEIEDKRIEVLYKEVQANDLLNKDYDEVILASGAKPIIPQIPGLNKYYWADLLTKENLPENMKVLIIGGGLIGIEAANSLAENSNEVIIVELLDEIGRGMEILERKLTLQNLEKLNVKIYKKYEVVEIKDNDRTSVIKGDETFEIKDIDYIVVSVGMRSDNSLKDELEEKINYHIIGDAIKPAKVENAIHQAFDIAVNI